MTIKIINGKPTRMLENVEHRVGKVLRRIEEGDNYFVYASWVSDDGQLGDFEVFKKMIRPKTNLDKNTEYEYIEAYPSSFEWGTNAWSYTHRKYVDRQIKKIKSKGNAS